METYKNLSGKSGVVAFEIEEGSIKVQFEDGAMYLDTNHSAGADNVARMKELAREGRGLSAFIVRRVRKRYEAKLR